MVTKNIDEVVSENGGSKFETVAVVFTKQFDYFLLNFHNNKKAIL